MPSVVICGSYHRDSFGLARIFRELQTCGCRILSPLSIDFTNTYEPIVRTIHEQSFTLDELERFHLRAIAEADFVWLHAPLGHVGTSGSFELGYAAALHIPIYTNHSPTDEMLQTRVHVVGSVFEALDQLKSGS